MSTFINIVSALIEFELQASVQIYIGGMLQNYVDFRLPQPLGAIDAWYQRQYVSQSSWTDFYSYH